MKRIITSVIPESEILDILDEPCDKSKIAFIGVINRDTQTMTLLLATFEKIEIPLGSITNVDGSLPDFSRFKIIDYGNTIAFGIKEEFQISVDWAIDEFRRLNQEGEAIKERMFPVLLLEDEHPTCPREIPWRILVPFEERIKEVHGRRSSLEALARQGGLSPIEIIYAIRGSVEVYQYGSDNEIIEYIKNLVRRDPLRLARE